MGAMQYGLRWCPAAGLLRHVVMPALVLATTACYGPVSEPRSRGSWVYEVEAPPLASRVVTVEATFDGAQTERFGISHDIAPYVRNVSVRSGSVLRPVERRGDEWIEHSCVSRCTVRYSVDLDGLADATGDEVDSAHRVGDATLSPSLAWLAHPVPRHDVPVRVTVHGSPTQFASGMNAVDEDGKTFAFRAFDLDEGSFTAFGPMRRYRISVPSERGPASRLDVAIVGTNEYAMADAALVAWVEDAARVTASLFGRFPVPRATLFIVPAKGEEEVVFGKVLSLAGASAVVVVGDRMQASSRHRDWVLVHELFHLGFPTFRGEGRWLGEGLATYYEPVLRARAGWTSEAEVFRQFARNMPRGQPQHAAVPSAGLAAREDLDTIYWGGALFCLAADVRIREQTRGRRSLDDVIRAILDRGGDATRVWKLRDVVALGDLITGTNVLSSMYERHAAHSERIDIDGLLASLGVAPQVSPASGGESREGAADTHRYPDDSGPLAWVRRGIVEVQGNRAIAQTTRR